MYSILIFDPLKSKSKVWRESKYLYLFKIYIPGSSNSNSIFYKKKCVARKLKSSLFYTMQSARFLCGIVSQCFNKNIIIDN